MSTYQQCECNFCGSTLQFEVSKRNELVNCDYCAMETVLFVPGAELPYPREEFFLQATNVGWSKHVLGFRNVVGAVVNTSNKDLDWVRIEFTLVNRQAIPVGSTSDCLITFPVNGIWRFHAPVFQLDAVGVGAPLLSCEYGKISVPKAIVAPAAVSLIVPPGPAPQHAPPTAGQETAAKRTNQWGGLRITGGVTGVAHRQ
jgi:hypothetical protein